MSHLITKKHQLLLLIAIFLSCWTYSQENINDGGNDPKNAVLLKSAITWSRLGKFTCIRRETQSPSKHWPRRYYNKGNL